MEVEDVDVGGGQVGKVVVVAWGGEVVVVVGVGAAGRRKGG